MGPIAAATSRWVNDVVIGLALCPWAQPARDRGGIRYAVTLASTPQELSAELASEIQVLQETSSIETTLLIHPRVFHNWEEYYPWLVVDAEGWLEKEGLEEDFQVVGFHPSFCFGGEDFEDASNWTNRSPFPMTHILRQLSVEEAIKNHPNPMAVPEANKCLMRKLGMDHMKEIVARCLATGGKHEDHDTDHTNKTL
mmetsp:Transcript_17563/g.53101  ORF Transcript_17563/g.53101 Transcript_17563/m.53101 type:complete len:197 (-) Transcript_17563:18-608(-)